MGLTQDILEIIEQNYATINSDIPFKDILIDLRCAHILSDDEVEELQQCRNNKTTGFEFIRILKSRNDKDFFNFCQILQDSQIANVQNLGFELEKEANQKLQAQGWSSIYEIS